VTRKITASGHQCAIIDALLCIIGFKCVEKATFGVLSKSKSFLLFYASYVVVNVSQYRVRGCHRRSQGAQGCMCTPAANVQVSILSTEVH
jgi:hypothetical protein